MPVKYAVDTGVVGYVAALTHNWLGWDWNPADHLTILARDGRRVVLEVSSRLIVEDGQPVGVQGDRKSVV